MSVCLFVCLYPINVKTAEPIGAKFFLGSFVIPGNTYSEVNQLQITKYQHQIPTKRNDTEVNQLQITKYQQQIPTKNDTEDDHDSNLFWLPLYHCIQLTARGRYWGLKVKLGCTLTRLHAYSVTRLLGCTLTWLHAYSVQFQIFQINWSFICYNPFCKRTLN